MHRCPQGARVGRSGMCSWSSIQGHQKSSESGSCDGGSQGSAAGGVV